MVCPQRAEAQSYRVTWLADPADPATNTVVGPDILGTIGINNKGQVVYGYTPGSGIARAFVWLPVADYGLSAGWHDISEVDDIDSPSIARDINESGVIVGQSGGIHTGFPPFLPTGRVTIWRLDETITAEVIADTLGGDSEWSGGFAINDTDPPLIVGGSSIMRPCSCTGTGDLEQTYSGFSLVLDNEPELEELMAGNRRRGNLSYDVNTPTSGSPRIPGYARCGLLDHDPCFSPPMLAGKCNAEFNPVYWVTESPTDMTPLEIEFDAYARGINNNNEIVGRGNTDDPESCFETAIYWPAPTASPFALGSIMPAGQGEDYTRAEAINNLELPKAVGGSTFPVELGMLWEKTDSGIDDWIATDLNSLIPQSGTWEIKLAHDINDSNWIVAFAEKIDVTPHILCAVLLTPVIPEEDCPEDLNHDGTVGVPDLLAVINAWGSCPVAAICWADINRSALDMLPDGTVGTPDLLAVTNAWGPCEESFMGGSGQPSWMDDIIDILNDPELTESEQIELIQQILEQES